MKTSMNPEEEDLFANTPEEELVDNKDPLSVEQEHTDPAGDTNTSMEDESNLSSDNTFHFKKEIWGRNKWSFLLIIIVAAVIASYTLPAIFKDRYDIGIPAPVSEKTDYIDVDEADIPESLTADIPSDGPAVKELPQDMEQETPEETVTVQALPEDVTEPTRLPMHTEAALSKAYYIQVGTWRNPAYAESTLTKLKQYYPDVYVIKKNNFNVIRISDIRNKQEGTKIIKDIREKFNLNSLLILRK
ncbi:MAG: SPOR domain-containing protein [Nitrospirota bacterium]